VRLKIVFVEQVVSKEDHAAVATIAAQCGALASIPTVQVEEEEQEQGDEGDEGQRERLRALLSELLEPAAEALCHIFYTSGSTGVPKVRPALILTTPSFARSLTPLRPGLWRRSCAAGF
jgi:long-subunit acyl-CoA synthetase (AMP-forming)